MEPLPGAAQGGGGGEGRGMEPLLDVAKGGSGGGRCEGPELS